MHLFSDWGINPSTANEGVGKSCTCLGKVHDLLSDCKGGSWCIWEGVGRAGIGTAMLKTGITLAFGCLVPAKQAKQFTHSVPPSETLPTLLARAILVALII
jgi:hypothetical protein